MKFIRKKYTLNENVFKSVDDIKADRANRQALTANDVSNLAKKNFIDSKKTLIEKLMLYWFVDSIWWVNSALSKECNLRPGTTAVKHFNMYLDNITEKSEQEQLKYLHSNIDYSVYFDADKFTIEVPFEPSDNPINSIVFMGNSFFNYLDKIEKSFEEYLKIPVNLKIRLKDAHSPWLSVNKIHYIEFNHSVAVDKLINFFSNRVVNLQDLNYEYLELRILNRIDDTSFDELFKLGNYIKFRSVVFRITSSFATRRFKSNTPPEVIPREDEEPMPVLPIDNIDGVENLLRDTQDCYVTVSKIYKNNPDFMESIKGKKYILTGNQ